MRWYSEQPPRLGRGPDRADAARARTVDETPIGPYLSRTTSEPPLDRLQSIASRAGLAWADACARALQSQKRPIVGAWPGTLTEARGRVLAALATGDHGAISLEMLSALARTANRAARDAWRSVAVPDEEA